MTARVWWARPSQTSVRCIAWLDDVERDRYARYLSAGEAGRFLTGVGLVRAAVAGVTGVGPADVRVDRRCDCGANHGRVRLPGTGLSASVAHSGDLVGVVLSRYDVGIDVEPHTSRPWVEDIASSFLSSAERASRIGPSVLERWTRKEAVVKALGTGMSVPLDQVEIDVDGQVRAVAGDSDPSGLRLITLRGRPGYVAVLAAAADRPHEPLPEELDGEALMASALDRAD